MLIIRKNQVGIEKLPSELTSNTGRFYVQYAFIKRPIFSELESRVRKEFSFIEEKLAIELLDYIYYFARREYNITNERMCNVHDKEQYDLYISKMKNGHNQSMDETIFVYDEKLDSYELYMVGCNFG